MLNPAQHSATRRHAERPHMRVHPSVWQARRARLAAQRATAQWRYLPPPYHLRYAWRM